MKAQWNVDRMVRVVRLSEKTMAPNVNSEDDIKIMDEDLKYD